MDAGERHIYEFGKFTLNADEMALRRGGEIVPLTPKAVETLLALIRAAGRVVAKDDLMQAVWRDSFVEETGLTRNISVLRKALGETDKNNPQFIETLPRRGYRFVAEVRRTSEKIGSFEANENAAPSLAVLPFKTLGGENEYLSLGLADALITALSNVRRLIVRPTAAVWKYHDAAGGERDSLRAGRALGVQFVLEGIVLQSADALRVTVQLIEVETARPLWGEKFDEPSSDIFALQDSLSERVARALVENLSPEEENALEKNYTTDEEAYREYLYGRFQWNKRTPQALQKAVLHYERAVALDPAYALAYAAMSEAYVIYSQHNILPPAESWRKAKQAAQRALQLDENIAGAHTALAQAAYFYEWDWAETERKYHRAVALAPNYETAHHWYALFLGSMRRFDEALAAIRRALAIDPLSLIINRNLAVLLFFAGETESAIRQSRRTVELDVNFPHAHLTLAHALARAGEPDEAIKEGELSCRLMGRKQPAFLGSLGSLYAIVGREPEARDVLAELHRLAAETHVQNIEFAIIHANLNEPNEAFRWLEKSFAAREENLVTLVSDPDFAPLREDARFLDLARRISLPI